MKYNEISISDPRTGEVEAFGSIKAARAAASRKDYTPVFINLYDDTGIVDDIRIENKGQPVV